MRRFPDFIIIGAQKGGTTSLWRWLCDHPQCFLPEFKEPNYFTRFEPWIELLASDEPIRDTDAYLNLFREAAPSQILGEASPSYLFEEGTAQRIYEKVPSCRFIVSLRDPVSRAYSEYLMYVAAGMETRTFSEAVQDAAFGKKRTRWSDIPLYIELGKYGTQLSRYYDLFPKEQIRVITVDQIRSMPVETMEGLSNFLDISPQFWNDYDYPRENRGGVPRNELMRRLLASRGVRHVSTRLFKKHFRGFVIEKIMSRPPRADDISMQDREVIWSFCEDEIRLAESLIGRHFPELWKTYPEA